MNIIEKFTPSAFFGILGIVLILLDLDLFGMIVIMFSMLIGLGIFVDTPKSKK